MDLNGRLNEIESLLDNVVNDFKPITQAQLTAARLEIFDAIRDIRDIIKQLEQTVNLIEKRIGE